MFGKISKIQITADKYPSLFENDVLVNMFLKAVKKLHPSEAVELADIARQYFMQLKK